MTIFVGDGFHFRARDGRVLLLWPTPGTTGGGLPTGGGGGPAPIAGGGIAAVPTISSTIYGGLNITNNWPDILNSREAAEMAAQRVAEILGQKLTNQQKSYGLPT